MPKDIKGLLSQKTWSGEDVGKALIFSLIHDVQNKGTGKGPLFTQADFEKMETSLQGPADLAAYGTFREIHSGVVAAFNKGQGLVQQFYNGYFRVFGALDETRRVDNAQGEWEAKYGQQPSPFDLFTCLDDIAKDENRKKELTFCGQTLMKPALRYLAAYNGLVEIIGRVYDIPGMDCLACDLASLQGRLDTLNQSLHTFHETAFGDATEKARKQALLRELFQPVSLEALQPAPETAAKIAETLKAKGMSPQAKGRSFDDYLLALMGERA